MSSFWHHIWCALEMSLSMGWEILWALVLGFTFSAIVQAVVTKSEMKKWLAKHDLKSIVTATLFGAASSSCSYAATAITRALIKQGADFTAAMVFQFASTNLVLELGILLALLLGWQFTAGQFVGGIMMIGIMTLIFRFLMPPKMIATATEMATKDLSTEKKMTSNQPVAEQGSLIKRIFSEQGKTTISQYFFMDWAMLWTDIAFGLIVAGILASWVPDSFWTILLCKDNSIMAHWLNPLIGPLIAILSFVCSVGNVPLAAVLWQSGMTFGGVLSFIFADLLVFPLLNIYRKYYGVKMATFLAGSFYVSMVLAAYSCEWLFNLLGIIPSSHEIMPKLTGGALTYTNVLNILALIFMSLLFKSFRQTGGFKTMVQNTGEIDKSCCH